MSGWIQKIILAVVTMALILLPFAPAQVKALSQCFVELTPSSVAPMSVGNFDITITNTGSTDINWIDITVPVANFMYAGNSIYSWSTADHGGGTTLTGSSLNPGDQETFSVTATADIVSVPSATWQISAGYTRDQIPTV